MPVKLTPYKHVVIADAQEKPTDEEIKALEKDLTTSLPESYRAFLDIANSGDLGFYYLDVPHPEMTIPRSFGFLYGTKPKMAGLPMGQFSHELVQSRDGAQLPNEVLPVARDSSGCELYLDLTPGEGSGNVVAFIQGIEGWEDQPKDNAWVTVALDWDDYLNRLKLEEVFCKEQLDEAIAENNPEKLKGMIDLLNKAKPDWREDKSFADYAEIDATS